MGSLLALTRLMHRTPQKGHSAKFACKVFSEVDTVFSCPPLEERVILDTRRRTVPPPHEPRPAFLVVTR
jgi:hypothetical protein